jgi:hypothetical protein
MKRLALALVLAACGSPAVPFDAGTATDAATDDAGSIDAGPSDAGASDAGVTDAGGRSPYPPPLVPTQGGPVLAQLKVVTITFTNDPDATLKEGFGDWLVGSAWMAAAAEYGVLSATHLTKVRIGSAAPATATEAEIRAFLAAKVADGTLAAPTAGTLFAIHYPATTALALTGYIHCTDFSGYHSETSIDGQKAAFAAIGACPTYVNGLSAQENMLRTASHEIIEAATDPLTFSDPAFIAIDDSSPWYFYAGEVGDICPLSQVFRENGFLAQRFWSNQDAVAGLDPCVPVPAGEQPYLTAADPSATVRLDAGTSFTFTLHGVAPAGAAAWTLQAKSSGSFNSTPQLDTAISGPDAVTHLTVSVPAGTAPGKYSLIPLYSYRSTSDYHLWPVAVIVR